MPENTHLKLISMPEPLRSAVRSPSYDFYARWKTGKMDADEVIDACKGLLSVVEYDAITMTEEVNMFLDLDDLNWCDLVACLAMHRTGCWGDAPESLNHQVGIDAQRVSEWSLPNNRTIHIISEFGRVQFNSGKYEGVLYATTR